jgi:predicted RNA methylase
MPKKSAHPAKDLYRELRALPWLRLWEQEVPSFNSASPDEKLRTVALIRAIGAGFTEASQPSLKEPVRQWLLSLLADPAEKIRRYAMTALPKIGAGRTEERQLLYLLSKTSADREKKFLGKALEKIGGSATLDLIRQQGISLPLLNEQRAKANLARQQKPSSIRFTIPFSDVSQLRIHLRCRTGLEPILSQEVKDSKTPFRIVEIRPGLLTLAPTAPLRLDDLFSLRCFSTASFLLGTLQKSPSVVEPLANLIASPLGRSLLQTFTDGPIRYRFEWMGKGHQRSAVRQIAQRVYALCPDLLNDSREAPWAIEIHPTPMGDFVELRPRLSPDPRFPYRQQDVPAASHPPLAAAMARLAGPFADETVWDPFCGSALELIERVRLTGVRRILGTDLSPDAIQAARANWQAARFPGVSADFVLRDFRDFEKIPNYGPASISLLITNPPLGKRVPIPNLRGLLEELFTIASVALRPGGRMVWINPLKIKPPASSLRLEFQQTVDLGGFACRLELLRKR